MINPKVESYMATVRVSCCVLILLCGVLLSSCEIKFSKPGISDCEEHDADCVKNGTCSGHPDCAAHERCSKDKPCKLHPQCVKYELNKKTILKRK